MIQPQETSPNEEASLETRFDHLYKGKIKFLS